MKSLSLCPPEDIEVLEAVVRDTGASSRVAAVRHALRVVATINRTRQDDASLDAAAQADWQVTRERLFAQTAKIKRRLQGQGRPQ